MIYICEHCNSALNVYRDENGKLHLACLNCGEDIDEDIQIEMLLEYGDVEENEENL